MFYLNPFFVIGANCGNYGVGDEDNKLRNCFHVEEIVFLGLEEFKGLYLHLVRVY